MRTQKSVRLLTFSFLAGVLSGLVAAQDELELNFKTPPQSAEVWVYWFHSPGRNPDLKDHRRPGSDGASRHRRRAHDGSQ
jgi:hypothetical protein